jgi:hypothetical protein
MDFKNRTETVQSQKGRSTMPGLSHQKTVAFCELLSTTLKEHLPEMPHLTEESTSLDGLITELKGLSNEQEALKGRSREISRLRREAEQRSQSLRSRIVAQLQGKLGFKNESLLAFGITPRKTRRRRATAPPEEQTSTGPKKSVAQDAASSSSGT